MLIERFSPAGRARPRRCRRSGRFARLCLLLAVLSHQGVQPANSTVFSDELRELADTQLLFWSGLDCVIDAALNFFGPIDDLLRGEEPSAITEKPSDDASASVHEEEEDDEEEGEMEVSPFNIVLDNHTLIREAKTILSNFVRNAKGEDNNGHKQHEELEETDEESSLGTSPTTAETDEEDSSVGEETQDHNHSSPHQRQKVPRGGGRRQKFEFSLYQDGDGSERDPDGIPQRYLDMHNGNRDMARKSLADTLQWREENKIDTILSRPHTKFDICKHVFPSSFLGRDPRGHVIFLQRPALMDLELAKRNKLKKEDLLDHYIYINEYLWQIVEGDRPLGTMVSVMDLTGVNMGMLRKREYINFLKLFVSVMDSHFPQRAHKTLIVNAPKWVNTLYRILTPLLREETKSRIEIYSKNKKQDEALKRYLGPKEAEKLPASFWSKNKSRGKDAAAHEEPTHLPESEMDAKLRAHVSFFFFFLPAYMEIHPKVPVVTDDFTHICATSFLFFFVLGQNRLTHEIMPVERKCSPSCRRHHPHRQPALTLLPYSYPLSRTASRYPRVKSFFALFLFWGRCPPMT